MDIWWTLLFALCFCENFVSPRKKHKRSPIHNDVASKLKKTKQTIYQAMLTRTPKVKRHVPSGAFVDHKTKRLVPPGINADQKSKRRPPSGFNADKKSKRQAKRQASFGFHASHIAKHHVPPNADQKAKRQIPPNLNSDQKVKRQITIRANARSVSTDKKAKRQVSPRSNADQKVKRQITIRANAVHLISQGKSVIKRLVSPEKKHKRSISIHDERQDDDTELRRTKRNLYQQLLMRRRKGKRQVPSNFNMDMMGMPRSPIARPMVKGQVQVVNFQIKVVHDWRVEMLNVSSPEYELLVGNIVDAFANELTADYHFHSSAVTKLRKADRNHMILADVATRFYKTEGNPLPHLQGIISKGWVSGQKVDPEYFVVLGILNGNMKEIGKLKFPQKLKLRLVPPRIETKTPPPPSENETERIQKTLKFKEIRISIKLKQLYGMFLSDRKSPEFKELGGNLEQAIFKIFSRDSFFIGTKTLGFRESPEGRCIAVIAIDFKTEEKYAIEKMQAMISGGDLAGMPVDDTYLIVNSLSEVHLNGTVNKPANPPNPLVHPPNGTTGKDVTTSPPISTVSYQAKTVAPNIVITTAPPEARSNVSVSEAVLAVQSPSIETPVNITEAAPELLQNTSAPIVEVVDSDKVQDIPTVPISPQVVAPPKPDITQSQVYQVFSNVTNASLILPTFQPAVEGQAVVNANVTNETPPPETKQNGFKYLVNYPGVSVAEFVPRNDSVASLVPAAADYEPKNDLTQLTIPIKLVKGAKLNEATVVPAAQPNVVQVPLIPLNTPQANPSSQYQPSVADITSLPAIVTDASKFLPSLVSLPKGESQAIIPTVLQPPIYSNTTNLLYNASTAQNIPVVTNAVPPVVYQLASPINIPISTEATSKLLSPSPQAHFTNLTTYPGLLPSPASLQPQLVANLTIPVNLQVVPQPSVDITAQLLNAPQIQTASRLSTSGITAGTPIVTVNNSINIPSIQSELQPAVEENVKVPAVLQASEASNTSNPTVPLANISQPYDIASAVNQSQTVSPALTNARLIKTPEPNLDNLANMPEVSQTPMLFPQPMSKLTSAPSVIGAAGNESTTVANVSNAALLPEGNTSLDDISSSINIPGDALKQNAEPLDVPVINEVPALVNTTTPGANTSAIIPSAKKVQLAPSAFISPEAFSAPSSQSQLLSNEALAILSNTSLLNTSQNEIPAILSAPAFPDNPITVAPGAPYKRPTVANIISSLTNTSIGVPAVHETGVTSDVISSPVNQTADSAANDITDIPIESEAPVNPVTHAPAPYRRPTVAEIIGSLDNTSASVSSINELANVSINVPAPNPNPAGAQNISTPAEAPSLAPVQQNEEEAVADATTASSNESASPLPAQEQPQAAQAAPITTSVNASSNELPADLQLLISNVTSVSKPSPALPLQPQTNDQNFLPELSQPILERQMSAPLQYKEVVFAIRVYHLWDNQLVSNDSVAYVELSGQIEQAIDNVLAPKDPFYVDVGVQEFLRDPEKITIAHVLVRFLPEELHPLELIKDTITNGNLTGVTVDKDFFFLLSYDKSSSPESVRNETIQNAQTYLAGRKQKPKPLMFKEIRFSLKMNELWNSSFGNNNTMTYAVFSGMVEQAVDRGLMSDPNYIDSTVLELEKAAENKTFVYVAVRFRIQEEDLEGKMVNLITNGSLSGIPLDKNFFEVFSLSETHHPKIGLHVKPPDEVPLLSLAEELIAGSKGQKQSATNNGVKIKGNESQVTNTSSAAIQVPVTPALISNNTTQTRTELPTYTPIGEDAVSDMDVVLTATSPPSLVQSVASDRVVTMTPSIYMKTTVTMPPPDVIPDMLSTAVLPTESPFSTKSVPHGGDNSATEQPGGSALNQIEGSMILQQKWHPYLSDKSSNEYKLLEEILISEIKNLYAQSNEEVIPQVVSFTEAETPSSLTKNGSDTQISIRFKVMFLPGHESNPGPLQSAIEANSLGDLTIYPTSFLLKTKDAFLPANGFTSCQQLHSIAVSASDGQIGGFIPECTPDGNFKSVQCHALTGFCWCVNHVGVRITGTEERYKEPSCEGMILTGKVILPSGSPPAMPSGSCLTVSIQEFILCGGEINCHIPLLGNKTFRDVKMVNGTIEYSLPLMQLRPGTYVLTAVVNVGWCRINSVLSKDLIHQGDYHTTVLHDVVVEADTKVIHKDIQVELLRPEETGINLSGDITLPTDVPTPLPAGSCLVIQTKSWNPAYPIIGNMTVMEPDVVNNTMSYVMHIPDIDPGSYIIRCILHLGECDMADNAPKPGDYYMEKKYEVSPDTTEVEEDLALAKQTEHNKEQHESTIPTIPPTLPVLLNKPPVVESIAPPATTAIEPLLQITPVQTSPPANQSNLASASPSSSAAPSPIVLSAVSPPALSAPAPLALTAASSAPESAAPSTSAMAQTPDSAAAAANTSSASLAGITALSKNGTSSNGEFDYQFTLLTNPNYVDPANRTEEDKYMVQTGLLSTNNSNATITNTSDPLFIALPNGLPKSCQGIRDAGIGNLDGQYIIEARPGCHISVICVNMDDENTKEFLGGPSEAEWKYWHYAVLIKISESDKRNLPKGACLEFSAPGKELLHRIMVAGARDGSPISKWKTKLSNIIRRKRNLPKKVSIITKPKLIRIHKEEKNKMWTSK